MVFTPYYHWRSEHATHHRTSGDLGRRGVGVIRTMTVQEYLKSSRWRRFAYVLARNPAVLFAIARMFLFLFLNRVPSRMAGRREWLSVWWTNIALLAMCMT